MSGNYYLDMDGKTAGPFTVEEVRNLYAAGVVSGQTLFSKPDAVEWLPLSTISALLRIDVVPPVIPMAPSPMPIKAENPPVVRQKVLVERTSKPIKAADALFKLAFLTSVVVAIFCEGGWRALGVFGCLIFLLAIILTRWVRWWQHD